MKSKVILEDFIKYVSMNVIGMIGLSCYILADTYFIANALGINGLTSLNFAISIFCIISGTGMMIGIGGGSRYSILVAQNKFEASKNVFANAVILGIIIGVLFTIVGIIFSYDLARLLGADSETIKMTNLYIRMILIFSPVFILNFILTAFVRNDFSPKHAMRAMLIGSLSNIILDYIFIYPLSMGMFGAVLATCLSPMISLFILSFHFIEKKNHLRFQLIAVKLSTFIDIAKLGNSAFISEFSSSVVLIVFNLTILRLEGNIGIAAYGIIANVALVVVAIFTGVCQGMQPLISRGYGLRDSELIKKTIRYAIITVLVISLLVYLITISNTDKIINLFNKNQSEQLMAIATRGFRIYFIGLIFAGFNMIIATYLNATERTRSAMIISLIRGILLIVPCVIILAGILGMTGVWLAIVITEFIVSVGIVFVRVTSERISINLEIQYESE